MATQSHLEESLEYLLGHLVTHLPGVGGMFWGTFACVWISDGGIFCVLGGLLPAQLSPNTPISSLSPPTGTNNSESRKTKKKKPHLGLVSGAPGLGSSKKKKPKPPAPHTPSIYDDIN